MACNLPHSRASEAWAYTAGVGTVSMRPRVNQALLWEPTRAARERFHVTPAPRGKRLHNDEVFVYMQRRGLVWSRTHEKKRAYAVIDIIKGANLLGHYMFKGPHEYHAHKGIVGSTEKSWYAVRNNRDRLPECVHPEKKVLSQFSFDALVS